MKVKKNNFWIRLLVPSGNRKRIRQQLLSFFSLWQAS